MTPEQFVYWLQGYLELSEDPRLNLRQLEIIKNHLDTVFKKVTPEVPKRTRQEVKWSFPDVEHETKIC